MVVCLDIDKFQGDEALVSARKCFLFAGCFCVDVALVSEVGVAKRAGAHRRRSYNPWRCGRCGGCGGFGSICSVALLICQLAFEFVDGKERPV